MPIRLTPRDERTLEVFLDEGRVPGEFTEGELNSLIETLRGDWRPLGVLFERRDQTRRVLDGVLTVIPLDDITLRPCAAPVEAEGRDVSSRGVRFVHREPLAFRHVLVELPSATGQRALVITRLRWCRFRGPEQYESGGAFVRGPVLG